MSQLVKITQTRAETWLVLPFLALLLGACGARAVPTFEDAGPRCAWRRVKVTSDSINEIQGVGPTDVYLSADRGQLFHFDGQRWSKLETPSVFDKTAQPVVHYSPRGLYLARPYVARKTSTGWELLGQLADALAVIETSRGEIFAGRVRDGVYKYADKRWTKVFSGREHIFYFFEAQDGTVFASGGGGTLRYDGTAWTAIPPPAAEPGDYHEIWAPDKDRYWVTEWRGQVYYFDGKSHTTVLDTRTTWATASLWGTSSTNVYVGGYSIWHFDGKSWTEELKFPASNGSFVALWGSGPEDIWAGGSEGVLYRYSCRPN